MPPMDQAGQVRGDDRTMRRHPQGTLMEKLHFSSDDFAMERDDRSRFSLWCDRFIAHYGTMEITRADELPFDARFDFLSLRTVGAGLMSGPFEKIMNAGNRTDAFALAINSRSLPITYSCRGREVVIEPQMATLIALDQPGGGCRRADAGNEWFVLRIARKRLLDAVANVEDLLALPISRGNEALGYLSHYLSLLFNPNVALLDQQLIAHVDNTIFDLVVLLLGANRDAEAIARRRGLRAVRLREILSDIDRGYSNPAFSARAVAERLGLSVRYVYELAHETGIGFSDRVLELRLQRARALLEDPRHDGLKVSDIALMVGFNEVSHFNRCFRRRFGITPTGARGRS